MGAFDEAPEVEVTDREQWRAWLEEHHATATSAWLVTYRPGSGFPVVDYEASVEEALCFGWVDSRGGGVDERRTKLYFARRKPTSGWAGPNKRRIAKLLAEGKMRAAGLAAVETAKANGAWERLDAVERLDVPDDLAAAFDIRPPARANWDAFPRSARRAILEWIVTARRPETRAARIHETATCAARNERANERAPRE